jgi:hypothetical protein
VERPWLTNSRRSGSAVFLLVVAVSLVGTSCAAPEAATAPTIASGIRNLTPKSTLPNGLKPITVLATPNLACTLITPADASTFLAGASSLGQSLSNGTCWFTRATPVYKGLPTKMFLDIEPLNQYHGADQIFQQVRHARGVTRVEVDGTPAYWISLPVPLPLPPTVHVESGSLTTEKNGNFISAGVEFGEQAKSVSKQIMAFALSKLAST